MTFHLPAPSPVPTREAAISNLIAYNALLQGGDNEAINRLVPKVRSWYVYIDADAYYFAPSMYIGFENMTPSYYVEGTREQTRVLTTAKSNLYLSRWANLLEENDVRYTDVLTALETFCIAHSKKLNAGAKIFTFR